MRAVATVAPPLASRNGSRRGLIRPHYHRLYSHRDQARSPRVCRPADPSTRARSRREHARPRLRQRPTRAVHGRPRFPRHRYRPLGRQPGARTMRVAVRTCASSSRTCGSRSARERVRCACSTCSRASDISKRPRDHSRVIGNIAAALTGGGMLVLDYLNAYHVERHLVASEVVARGEVRYQPHPLEHGPGVLQADRDSTMQRCRRRSNTSSAWPS